MRPVDADALLEAIEKERQYLLARGQTGAEHILVHHFRNLVEDAPTVESVINMYPNGTTVHINPEDVKWNGGDLISREALREDLRRFFPTEVLEGIDPKTLFAQIMHDIDNAPAASDRYYEGYAQGYIHGSTGADWQGE